MSGPSTPIARSEARAVRPGRPSASARLPTASPSTSRSFAGESPPPVTRNSATSVPGSRPMTSASRSSRLPSLAMPTVVRSGCEAGRDDEIGGPRNAGAAGMATRNMNDRGRRGATAAARAWSRREKHRELVAPCGTVSFTAMLRRLRARENPPFGEVFRRKSGRWWRRSSAWPAQTRQG